MTKYHVIGFVVATVIVLQIYVRTQPVPDRSWPNDFIAAGVGDYELPGGYYAVRKVTAEQHGVVFREMLATPGLVKASYLERESLIYRSLFWGFPDTVHHWKEGDLLHIRGHLVMGVSDLGVNKARIQRWLDASGI